MTISLNRKVNNLNIDISNLSERFSLIFYKNFNRAIIDDYFSTVLSQKKNITLEKILLNLNYISLVLIDPETYIIIIDVSELNKIIISKAFKYNM